MLFKTFRSSRRFSKASSSSSPDPCPDKTMQLQQVASTDLRKIASSGSTSPPATATKPSLQAMIAEAEVAGDADAEPESRDFQIFMEKARRDEERRQKEILRQARDAERRRRDCNMDPWVARMGKSW